MGGEGRDWSPTANLMGKAYGQMLGITLMLQNDQRSPSVINVDRSWVAQSWGLAFL